MICVYNTKFSKLSRRIRKAVVTAQQIQERGQMKTQLQRGNNSSFGTSFFRTFWLLCPTLTTFGHPQALQLKYLTIWIYINSVVFSTGRRFRTQRWRCSAAWIYVFWLHWRSATVTMFFISSVHLRLHGRQTSSSGLNFSVSSGWWLALFNFHLRFSNCWIYFVFDFINHTATVQFAFNDFICLKESLQLIGKLIVLLCNKIHMFVQRFDFILHEIWIVN